MFARICANTGWTWDYVRNHVDLPMLQALEEEWLDHPPVHRLVAAYLDYQRPADLEAKNDEQLRTLMSALPVDTNAPKVNDNEWAAFVARSKENQHG